MLFDPGRVGRQSVTKTHAMTNAGIYTTPTLDLSFPAVGGGLDPQLIFTRASTATYFDSSGTMQTATTNAPRFDYDPMTYVLRGLLIEEARTNLMLQSADASNATWTKFGSVVVAPVVTANQTTAPDGTLTAARVVYPAVVGASAYSMLYQGITPTTAPYAFSVWLRGSAGGEQLYLAAEGSGLFYNVRVTLTTQWQRFVLVTPALTVSGWGFIIGTDLRDGAQTTTPGGTVYVWGAQLEQGAFPTSYIPTTAAAVTRAADNCQIPPANMGWFVSPGGSWSAEFIELTPVPNIQNGRIISAPGGGGIAPIFLAAANLGQFDGVGLFATANAFATGVVIKGASTYASGSPKICLNGGAVATGALTTGYGGLATSGIAFLITVPAGSVENTTGYIRRARYWPRILSDAEMQSVTT